MNIFKKFATVAFGTLFSRIFGFVREMLMAAAIGTGPVADAFNAAFRFPNSFRRLFAEGAFNAAFVPLFAKKVEENGVEEAQNFSKEVLGVLFTVLLLLTIVMELSMPFLVRYVIAPGFSEENSKFEQTTRFAMIMFPYLSCMSLAAMMSGILNSLRHYFAAAIAPVFLNIILIAVLAYSWYYDLDAAKIGFALSWGVLASGVLQLGILLIAVHSAGIPVSFSRPRFTGNVKQLLWLALPAAITGGITQINLLINTNIASKETGAISALAYADRLYQLPLGVIGIAVATVLLPELSRALRTKAQEEALVLQNRSLEFTLFLTLPASVSFCIIPYPLVELIYEHGNFTANSTKIVSQILTIYGLGLPAFVLIKAFVPLFMAREDTKTPMVFALISVIINCGLAITLFPLFSAIGIAIAEISAAWANVFLLLTTLLYRGHFKIDQLILKRLAKISCSAGFMGVALYLAQANFASLFMAKTLSLKLLALTTLIFCAGALYLLLTVITGAIPKKAIKRLVKKR